MIPEVYYRATDPYHWEIDNLPLRNIIRREDLINSSLDNVLNQMKNAIGTSGSVANRLNQSLADNGSLIADAVDEAQHSIEAHTDSELYVRMTREQSDKLDLVAEEANSFWISVDTDSSSGPITVDFNDGNLEIAASTSITPRIEAPNVLKFDLAFPAAAAHGHSYGVIPVPEDSGFPDYINYNVGRDSFVEDSLRVYINGVRIFADAEIYVPGHLVDSPWTLMSFTSDYTSGTFQLSRAIDPDDDIRIDFDIAYV